MNNQFGQSFGDRILNAVAERLCSAVCETDTVARFGGVQFAILVTDLLDTAPVSTLADKLIESLYRPFPFHEQYSEIRVLVGIRKPGDFR